MRAILTQEVGVAAANVALEGRILAGAYSGYADFTTATNVANDFEFLFVQSDGTAATNIPSVMAPGHVHVTLIQEDNTPVLLTTTNQRHKIRVRWDFGDTTNPVLVTDPDSLDLTAQDPGFGIPGSRQRAAMVRTAIWGSNANLGSGNLNPSVGNPPIRCMGWNFGYVYRDSGTYTITCYITLAGGTNLQSARSVTIDTDTRTSVYVAASGDNANTGATNSPWATPSYAISQISDDAWVRVLAGDTIDETNMDFGSRTNVILSRWGTNTDPDPIIRGPLTATPANSGPTLLELNGVNQGSMDVQLAPGTNYDYQTQTGNRGVLTFSGNLVWMLNTTMHGDQDGPAWSSTGNAQMDILGQVRGGTILNMVPATSNDWHTGEAKVSVREARHLCFAGVYFGGVYIEHAAPRFLGAQSSHTNSVACTVALCSCNHGNMSNLADTTTPRGWRWQYVHFGYMSQCYSPENNISLGQRHECREFVCEANHIQSLSKDGAIGLPYHQWRCTVRNNIFDSYMDGVTPAQEVIQSSYDSGSTNANTIQECYDVAFLNNTILRRIPTDSNDISGVNIMNVTFSTNTTAGMNNASNYEMRNMLFIVSNAYLNGTNAAGRRMFTTDNVSFWGAFGGNVFSSNVETPFQVEGNNTNLTWWQANMPSASTDIQEDHDPNAAITNDYIPPASEGSNWRTNAVVIDGVHHDYRLIERDTTASSWASGAIGLESI